MPNLFNRIVHCGVRPEYSQGLQRNIVLVNFLSLIMMCLALALSAIYFVRTGTTYASYSILLASGLFPIVFLLNHRKYFNISRIYLCLLIPLEVLVISIYTKIYTQGVVDTTNFFDGRYFILGSSLLPLLVIETREWKLLLLGLSASILSLALFDVIHSAFGVGFADFGLSDRNYYFVAYFYTFLTLLFMVGSMCFQKIRTEEFENQNELLIRELHESNSLLLNQKHEIEFQNHEIMAQSEELQTNQDQLVEALSVIEDQKNKLEGRNIDLQNELVSKNFALNETNDELIKHNNELRQFSYTISHNLRGPIARLLGLTQVMTMQKESGNTAELFSMADLVHRSAGELDDLLHDLSKIIDIRNDIYRIRERVDLQEVFASIRQELKDQWTNVSSYREKLEHCPEIYAIRPMVHSIIYNLISNAIKYRQIEYPLSISVESKRIDNYSVIEVADNGMGINLEYFKNDLFRMYKRFHMHTEGKGLGLYLIKVQAEAMGGFVEVDSVPNRGSLFRVWIKNPIRVEDQILFDHPKAQIYYNGLLDIARLHHTSFLVGEDYRVVYLKCLEILKSYKSRAWVFDLAAQANSSQQDLLWLIENILPEAKVYGLSRLALIIQPQPNLNASDAGSLSRKIGLKISIHSDLEDAIKVLKTERLST